MSVDPQIESITWRGMPAWRVQNESLTAVVTRDGAQLASLRLIGDEVEPMWQPPWPAAPAGRGDPAVFGDGAESAILPCLVGSFACIDRFGAAHPGEDRPGHGEAKEVTYSGQWEAGAFVLRGECPRAGLRVERRVVLTGKLLRLATTVSHTDVEPRPVEWCEHFTLGDPFLSGAGFRAGAERAWQHVEAPARRRFPADGPLAERAAADVLPMPVAEADPAGDIYTLLMEEPWVEVVNPLLDRRLRLSWDLADFGWLCLWTEHRSREAPPWNGRTRARGLEISTKPLPEGAPPPERYPAFAGRSTECLVPPGPEGMTKIIEIER